MARVADAPRDAVSVDGDGLDVRIDAAATDASPDASGITLLADVVVRASVDGTAILRVRRASGDRCAAVVVREGAAEFVLLTADGDGFGAAIAVAAGQTLHLTVLAGDAEALAQVEAQVELGGMGMGGEAEASPEPLPPPPPPPSVPPMPAPSIPAPDFPDLPVDELPQAEPPELPQADLEDSGGDDRERGIDIAPVESPAPAPVTPGPDGATPVPAFVDAQVPSRVVAGVAFDALVRLSRKDLAPTTGTSRKKAKVRFDPSREIEVAVQVRGLDFADGTPSVLTTTLPAEGEEARRLVFRLVPDAPGRGRITVTFTQPPVLTPLAVLALSTPIVAADEAGEPGADDGRRVEASVAAPPRELAALPALSIDESFSRGGSSLRITAKVGRTVATHTVRLDDKAAYVEGIYAELAGIRAAYAAAAKRDADEAAETARRDVRTLGARIARELLGDEVNALLWRKRRRIPQLMLQTSGELDIPWEIVHLVPAGRQRPDPDRYFLGDLGLTRWMYGTRRPTVIPLDPARVIAVAPEYVRPEYALPRAHEEIRTLAELLAHSPRSAADPAEFARALLDGFDLLHFAGHGHWRDAAPLGQEIAFAAFSDDLDDGSASYTDTDARRDLPELDEAVAAVESGAAAPFVFLSACDVGRLRSGAPGLGGFAEAFLRGGAGVFIGCSWAVRDDVTAMFVRTFYEHALGAQAPLGEAVLAARRAAREAGDLTSLAFTVFADPRARLVPR